MAAHRARPFPRPSAGRARGAEVRGSLHGASCGAALLRPAMSTPGQKVSDSLVLTNDAMLEGQLRALRKMRERLGSRVNQLNGLIVTAAQPVGRMKARGSVEALQRVIRELDEEIASLELERGS